MLGNEYGKTFTTQLVFSVVSSLHVTELNNSRYNVNLKNTKISLAYSNQTAIKITIIKITYNKK